MSILNNIHPRWDDDTLNPNGEIYRRRGHYTEYIKVDDIKSEQIKLQIHRINPYDEVKELYSKIDDQVNLDEYRRKRLVNKGGKIEIVFAKENPSSIILKNRAKRIYKEACFLGFLCYEKPTFSDEAFQLISERLKIA